MDDEQNTYDAACAQHQQEERERRERHGRLLAELRQRQREMKADNSAHHERVKELAHV